MDTCLPACAWGHCVDASAGFVLYQSGDYGARCASGGERISGRATLPAAAGETSVWCAAAHVGVHKGQPLVRDCTC